MNNLQLVPKVSLVKYSYGTTQLTINPTSEVASYLTLLQNLIEVDDLRAKGKELEFHITVRYGVLDDGNVNGIKDYFSGLKPFDIKFGETRVFLATPNSDDAAVIYVEVISPELEKVNKEVGEIGNFKPEDFVYHPHLTLAYVAPEAASKYVGLCLVKDKIYEVSNLEVRSKSGENPIVVELSKVSAVVANFGKLVVFLPKPPPFAKVGNLLVKLEKKDSFPCEFEKLYSSLK